jgi:hypothetical protein
MVNPDSQPNQNDGNFSSLFIFLVPKLSLGTSKLTAKRGNEDESGGNLLISFCCNFSMKVIR